MTEEEGDSMEEQPIVEEPIDEVIEGETFNPEDDPAVVEDQKATERIEKSEAKKEAISKLVVKNNNVPYQGDDLSQLRMSSTIAIANQMFNRKLGETFTAMSENPALLEEVRAMFGGVGHLFNEIYDAIYKDNKIAWRGADKKMHNVEVESIAEALLTTMMSVGGVIKDSVKDSK